MLDSPTGGDPVPTPTPEPSRGGKTITCEACESILHPSGDVKKKSDSLKKLEKHEEENSRLKEKVETLERELTELKTNRPAPTPEVVPTPGVDAPPENAPKKKGYKGYLLSED